MAVFDRPWRVHFPRVAAFSVYVSLHHVRIKKKKGKVSLKMSVIMTKMVSLEQLASTLHVYPQRDPQRAATCGLLHVFGGCQGVRPSI